MYREIQIRASCNGDGMMELVQSLEYEYPSLSKKLVYIDDYSEDVCGLLTSKYPDVKFVCAGSSYVESSLVFGSSDPGIAFLYRFYVRCLSRYRICIAVTENEGVLELAKNAIDSDVLRPLLKKFRNSVGIIMIVKVLSSFIETIEEVVKIAREVEKIFTRMDGLVLN